MMEILYTDFIISKPTFCLNLKTSMNRYMDDVRMLDESLQSEIPNLVA